ncbi:MAG: hypothetical protein ABI432_15940 [Flavobacteriales bacterium]
MRRSLAIAAFFLLLASLPRTSLGQLGIRFGGGVGVRATIYSSGRGGSVPPAEATWLESDVDVPPEYPGGAEAIAAHFRTDSLCDMGPVSASCRKKPEVLVWFIVEVDGSVQDAWIDRGGCEELQARAVCSVLNLQGWTSGRRGEYPVRTRMRMPVHYNSR